MDMEKQSKQSSPKPTQDLTSSGKKTAAPLENKQQKSTFKEEIAPEELCKADSPYDATRFRDPRMMQQEFKTGVPKPPERFIAGMPASQNHGAHELFCIHEVLHSSLNVLDQSLMLRPKVRSTDLENALDRQYAFLGDEYNMIVQAFATGQDPEHRAGRYAMRTSNQTMFQSPTDAVPIRRPVQSPEAVSDAHIAMYMLGLLKSLTLAKAQAALEVTNPVVRRVIADSLPNDIEMAYEMYLYLNQRKQYAIPQLPAMTMQTLSNAFAQVPQSPRAGGGGSGPGIPGYLQ